MFGKKRNAERNNVIVTIISNLTSRECEKMMRHIERGKRRHANLGRGTCTATTRAGVAQLLTEGHKKLTGK